MESEHWQSIEIRDNFGHVAFIRLRPFGARGVEVNVSIEAEVRPEHLARTLLIACRALPTNIPLLAQILEAATEQAIETIDRLAPSPSANDL